jgi:hypothetical protein
LALEREAVCVQEVGSAVQRDGRLSCAGAALHDNNATEGRANDLVLLGLNRGDDVGHPASPGTAECFEQCGFADEYDIVAVRLPRQVKDLVVDADHAATPRQQVSTANQTKWLTGGGPVERLGYGRAPINDERLTVFVVDGDPPDVKGLAVDPVNAAETQAQRPEFEFREPARAGALAHVALDRMRRLLHADRQLRGREASGQHLQVLEAGVGPVEVGLLGGYFGNFISHAAIPQTAVPEGSNTL